jgi:hypothetical protein
MALDAINRKAVYVHELTHYDQMVAGRLVFNFDLGLIYWLGEPYISFAEIPKATIEEYLQWPWEVEAYDNMSDITLFNKIINSKYWLELKGQDKNIDFIIKNL